MRGTPKKILEKFVNSAADSAISIVLVGSYALGNAHEDSDIDLIVLTKHQKDAEVIQNIGKDLNRAESRPVVDCKVYTESEFSGARTGLENRFLWTCLSNGKVLFGEDITKTIQLAPHCVSESYWQCVQSVNDACTHLGAGVQYTGSCFFLYDSLSTTYFVDRFIFRSVEDGLRKDDFIRSKLASEFSRARERYYWIVSRKDHTKSQSSLRVPTSVDRRFKRSDYERMHEKAVGVLRLVQDKYREVKKWSESVSTW